VISQRADCSGWVPRGFTEMSGRTTPLEGKHDLTAVSGDIHVRVSDVDKDDFDVSFVSDTVIHEATHKFLGTWDYSYVGAQGSVGRGLQDRSGMQTRAEDPGTWDATKAESAQRAHAQVAQAVVIEGLKPMLPEALDRTRPVRPSDPEGFVAAQKVYAMVSTWGSPQAAPPDADVLAATIALLCQQDALPSKAKSELKRFLSNRETFLAERGNELNVKGHDVLFALPTGYQLKNADSWTEVALTAGT
jgi:hypothetical protein